MNKLFDSFWRAALYCIHPRLIFLSLIPVMAMSVLSLTLGHFFWADALQATRSALESYELLNDVLSWFQGKGSNNLYAMLASVLLLCMAIPIIVMGMLTFVELVIMPVILQRVATRRFAKLERNKVPPKSITGVLRLVKTMLAAAIALLVAAPLCLIPPLIFILPSMIWGWLAYQVMSHDALAQHASREELLQILKEHQGSLLTIGMVSGYLGTIFSLVWITAAIFAGVMPIFVLTAIWTYALVFIFSSLWFVHYCLGALEQLRAKKKAAAAAAAAAAPLVFTPTMTLTQTPNPTLTLTLAPAAAAPTPPATPTPPAKPATLTTPVVAVVPKAAK